MSEEIVNKRIRNIFMEKKKYMNYEKIFPVAAF
jgi:hypothetical protein